MESVKEMPLHSCKLEGDEVNNDLEQSGTECEVLVCCRLARPNVGPKNPSYNLITTLLLIPAILLVRVNITKCILHILIEKLVPLTVYLFLDMCRLEQF